MNKFAFITHPMDIEDIHKMYPLSQKTPEIIIQKLSKTLLPIKVSHMKDVKTPRGETQGCCIIVPLTLEQIQTLPEAEVMKKIIKAGTLAKKLGVDIIGLGGGLSSIKEIDSIVESQLSIPVTTGQTYIVASVMEGVKRIVSSQKKDFKECEITIVVDESFPLGSVVARYLAREVKYLTLASKDKKVLESLYQKIFQDTGTAVHTSENIEASIKRGDIIIHSALENSIKPINIKPKSIVWDLSEYKKMHVDKPTTKKDMVLVDNSIIGLPGEIDFGVDLGFLPNACCANMAEVILLALENHLESFSPSQEVTLGKIDIINGMAMRNNLRLAGVSNIYKDRTIFKDEGINHD